LFLDKRLRSGAMKRQHERCESVFRQCGLKDGESDLPFWQSAR
jgi:hypothetical protein